MTDPIVTNHPPRHAVRVRARRGMTGGQALLVIAALGLVIAGVVYLSVFRGGPTPPTDPADPQPPQAAGSVEGDNEAWDTARAREELDALVEAFTAINNRGEPLDNMVRAARRLVERYPRFAEGRAFYGQLLMLAGRTDPAIEQFKLSLDLDRQQPGTHLLMGTLYLQTDRPVEAAKAFDQAVSLDPDNASYRLHLAQAHIDLEEYDKARRAFLEVIQHHPQTHQAYSGLADLYMRQNKTGLALTQLDRAIEHAPGEQDHVKTLYKRKKATALRRANDPEGALLVLQSIPFNQQSPAVIDDMAVCWAMLGKPGRGADLFKTALAMDPLNTDLLAGAIRWYEKAGNGEQRDRFARMLERTDPNHPALR